MLTMLTMFLLFNAIVFEPAFQFISFAAFRKLFVLYVCIPVNDKSILTYGKIKNNWLCPNKRP